MGNRKIGLRDIRLLKPAQIIWDAAVVGFGARRQRTNAVSYVLIYRTQEGRQRWHTIGRHGSPWTPDTARAEAQRLLGNVVTVGDPAAAKKAKRKAATVSSLCDQYFADAEVGRLLTRNKAPKKSSTLAIDKGRIERHIKPLLGHMKVSTVTREDVEAFMHDVALGKTAAKSKTNKKRGLARVRGGKGAASRAVGLLGGIFSYAVRHRMRPDNPAHGLTRFADGKRDRRLSDYEYIALGEALRQAENSNIWPPAIAATRFLALTGWRRNEALELQWQEVDLARRTATLAHTKTGKSVRPLSHVACDVLRQLPRSAHFVFPATRGNAEVVMSGFKKIWKKIARLGHLPSDVTPHTFRHSFASLAADLGYSEPTIAALVGHKGRTVTSRYVHTADAVLLAAADSVANRTVELMEDRSCEAEIIPLHREGAA